MQSQELYSHSLDFTATVAEVDRLPIGKEETPLDRQLCGVTIQCAKHHVRVSIHTTAGTISHSIARRFPDAAIFVETGLPIPMATNDEIQLEDIHRAFL